ncbi:unnamed protein product, partial [Sphagnum troendelagicum]
SDIPDVPGSILIPRMPQCKKHKRRDVSQQFQIIAVLATSGEPETTWMIHNNSGSGHYNNKTTMDDREKDRPTRVSRIARVTGSRPEQALKFQTAKDHQKCLKGFSVKDSPKFTDDR